MPAGMLTTSDLVVGLKLDIDEAIYLISPVDSPLINGVDADGATILGSVPTDQITFSWLDEELLLPSSTLNGAVLVGDAFITLPSDEERLKFSTGDVVRVAGTTPGERLRVTGYGTTTGTLLVSRGFAGTAAGGHADDSKIIGLGTALAEGSDPENARARDRVSDINCTQIFGPTSIHMSATEQLVAKYGVQSEFQHQVLNRTKENVVSREQAYLYGVYYNSTTSDIRTTGGLDHFIATNVDNTSTQLTVAAIEALQAQGYDRGGIGNILAANPASLGDLNALNDTGRVRVDIDDGRRGRQRVMVVHTEYGDVTVVRNRYIDKKDAFLWTRDQVIRRPLRPLTLEPLAKTGDSDKAQIVCEEGLEVKGEEHAAKFTALAY